MVTKEELEKAVTIIEYAEPGRIEEIEEARQLIVHYYSALYEASVKQKESSE